MHRYTHSAGGAALILCAVGILVGPAAAQTATPLERAVREELRGERDLRRIEVTADGGEVTLTGELDTFWSKSEAIRRALDVDGVDTVVSEIEIPPAESDEKLVEEVVKAMQRYPHYTMFDYLDGRINEGTVTLMGIVTPERDKAGELFERVAKIKGVQDVQNQIQTLTPSTGDNRLRRAIARQIFSSTHFERFAIQAVPPFHIIIQNSVVTLVGYVQGEIEYREMERIARQTQGVLRVVNQLQRVQ